MTVNMQKLAKVAAAGVASGALLTGAYGIAKYIQKRRNHNGVHEPEILDPKAKKGKKKAKKDPGKKFELKAEKKKKKNKKKKGKKE